MARTYRGVKLRYELAQRLALTLLVLPLSATTQAEITVDGSLGSFRGSLAGPDFQIDANLGRQVGSNLFHSFGAFNINHPESATFTANGSVGSIANVLGRVTGDSASTIDGLLRSTIPNANLFFINPHGVAFGPHAQLDVPGSFHVSTADYLRLEDGVRFAAQPSANDALLTTAPPVAFGFLSEQPAGISVQGSAIELKEGETLSLVGGDFDFVGTGLDSQGQPTSFLGAPSGRINLASVASSGEVSLGTTGLGLHGFTQLGQITLSQNSLVSTDGLGGGRIFIRGGRLVADSAFITANTLGDQDGKSIDINVTGELLDNDAQIQAVTVGTGAAGDITLKAGKLAVRNGASIFAGTLGKGRGGDVSVEAADMLLSGDGAQFFTGISAVAAPGSAGAAGNVTVKAGKLAVRNGAEIFAGTFGTGRGGDVWVEAADMLLSGDGSEVPTGILAQAVTGSTGAAGDVTVKADRLAIRDGAGISASTFGMGRGGDVWVEAADMLLSRDGSEFFTGITAQAGLGSTGAAGDVTVKADKLAVRNGAGISASTFGTGRGGDVWVEAADMLLSMDGSEFFTGIAAQANPGSTGAAGDVTVKADRLAIRDGARIAASTFGTGRGGSIAITARDIELSDRGGIFATSLSSSDSAVSGNIFIQARDSLRIFDRGEISVETTQANAGDINLNVGTLLHLRDNSAITSSVADGQGDGGNITIDPTFVVLDGSRIVANARQGRGGNIRIVADFFFASPDSLVSASSDLGIDGVVEIDSPDTDLNAGLVELPADFFDVATLLTQGCAPGADLSRLVVRKYEVLPDSPAALRVPLPGGLLNADAQGGGFALTREAPGLGFEHSIACDGG